MRYAREGRLPAVKVNDADILRTTLIQVLARDIHLEPTPKRIADWERVIRRGGDGLAASLNALWERDYLVPWWQTVSHTRSLKQIQSDRQLVEKLAGVWAGFIRRAAGPRPSDELRLNALCADPSVMLTADHVAKNGINLQIQGYWPGLLCDWENGEALIVEFIQAQTQDDADFQRLALVAWLIERALGLSARAVVLGHDGYEAKFSAAALATAAAQLPILFSNALGVLNGSLTLPRLSEVRHCEQCPHQGHCALHENDIQTVAQDAEKMALSVQWQEALQRLKLGIKLGSWQRGPKLWQITLQPQPEQGTTYEDLVAATTTLAGLLNQPVVFLPNAQGGMWAEFPRKSPQPWPNENTSPFRAPPHFPLGYTLGGHPHWGNGGGIWLTGSQLLQRMAWIDLWYQGLCRWRKPDAPLSLLVFDPHRRLKQERIFQSEIPTLDDAHLAVLALRSLIARLSRQTPTLQAWSILIGIDIDDWLNHPRFGPPLRQGLQQLLQTKALCLVSAENPLIDELWHDLPRLVLKLDNRSDSERCLGLSAAIDLTQGDGLLRHNGQVLRLHHPDWGNF